MGELSGMNGTRAMGKNLLFSAGATVEVLNLIFGLLSYGLSYPDDSLSLRRPNTIRIARTMIWTINYSFCDSFHGRIERNERYQIDGKKLAILRRCHRPSQTSYGSIVPDTILLWASKHRLFPVASLRPASPPAAIMPKTTSGNSDATLTDAQTLYLKSLESEFRAYILTESKGDKDLAQKAAKKWKDDNTSAIFETIKRQYPYPTAWARDTTDSKVKGVSSISILCC
jgi:hypothetical protein